MENEKGLRIIKARVEQDNYEAAELRIIKADNEKILKDLYIEKEFNNGEFYSVSDNVLVSLHRTLREGETKNLQIINKKGDILTDAIFSDIILDNNLFICVKSNSMMPSVLQNIALKEDNLKQDEINKNSDVIKNQMIETKKSLNPNGDLKYIYEDPYTEVVVYKVENDSLVLINDGISYVAVDSNFVYTHSNVVTDITKSDLISEEEVVNEVKEEKPVVEESTEENTEESDEEGGEEKTIDDEKENVNFDNYFEEEKEEVHEEKELNVEDYDADEEFDELANMISKLVDAERESKNTIRDYEEKIKDFEEKVSTYEEQVTELTEKLEKAQREVDSKTKKVNTLINENRRYIDENRELKSLSERLEEENKKLEEENTRYMKENKKLKEEAMKGKNRINAVISSIDEVLTGYPTDEKIYTKKK